MENISQEMETSRKNARNKKKPQHYNRSKGCFYGLMNRIHMEKKRISELKEMSEKIFLVKMAG